MKELCRDIEYTFTDDTNALPEKYAEYAGKTVLLEYDADKSNFETDMYTFKAAYRLKRVPSESDKAVADIRLCQYGMSDDAWQCETYDYLTEGGVSYTKFTDDGSNSLSVPIKDTDGKYVVEADIKIDEIPSENIVGMGIYSDDKCLVGVGFKSGEDYDNLIPCTSDNTLLECETASENGYSGEWIHIIAVCGKKTVNVTYIGTDTGIKYVDSQPIVKDVSSADKIVFGRLLGNDGCTMGVKKIKVYVPSMPETSGIEETEQTIEPPQAMSFNTPIYHISDIENIEYDMSSMFVSYKLIDENNEQISNSRCSITANGTFYAENGTTFEQNTYVGIYIGDTLVKRVLLKIKE